MRQRVYDLVNFLTYIAEPMAEAAQAYWPAGAVIFATIVGTLCIC